MKKLILILVITNAGCLNVRPVGPLADSFPQRPQVKEAPVLEPVVRQAGKPTPPSLYVTPSEITATNALDAAKRLQQEIDTDKRSLETMPKYTEVSNVK